MKVNFLSLTRLGFDVSISRREEVALKSLLGVASPTLYPMVPGAKFRTLESEIERQRYEADTFSADCSSGKNIGDPERRKNHSGNRKESTADMSGC